VNDDDKKPPSSDDAEYAVPSGSPDVYEPSYVPPDLPRGPESVVVGAPIALGPSGVVADAPGVVAAPYPPSPSSGVVPPSPSPSPDDAPILPPELTAQAALEEAVGAPSKNARKRARSLERDHDLRDQERDPSEPPQSRKTTVIAATTIVGGLGIATLVLLGRANSQRFEITCDATHAYAEQGRSFPPWGSKKLAGSAWAPITLPANAECQPRATENEAELTTWYLALLVDRATTTLTARDLLDTPMSDANGKATNQLDYVSTQLDQGLLLARAPDKRDQRREITRLQGDVDYWRAAARLRDASTVLLDAAKQFDVANQKRPRHATDAAAWSTFLHHLTDELRAGPNGPPVMMAPASGADPVGSTPVPVGAAIPVEPLGRAGSAETPPPSAPNVPSGGVLL